MRTPYRGLYERAASQDQPCCVSAVCMEMVWLVNPGLIIVGGMLVLSWRAWSKPCWTLWPSCSAQLGSRSSWPSSLVRIAYLKYVPIWKADYYLIGRHSAEDEAWISLIWWISARVPKRSPFLDLNLSSPEPTTGIPAIVYITAKTEAPGAVVARDNISSLAIAASQEVQIIMLTYAAPSLRFEHMSQEWKNRVLCPFQHFSCMGHNLAFWRKRLTSAILLFGVLEVHSSSATSLRVLVLCMSRALILLVRRLRALNTIYGRYCNQSLRTATFPNLHGRWMAFALTSITL